VRQETFLLFYPDKNVFAYYSTKESPINNI
jgi:hypothetical protein